ncbi:hypothetical protein JW921_06095 [Candidatus Fermentibacterales bacterium]|nr:hypothetical protein [Candidatus Fermentibacterales bacterium]
MMPLSVQIAAALAQGLLSLSAPLLSSSLQGQFDGMPATALGETRVYMRPGEESDPFGLLSPGESVLLVAATHDGWLGLDPGVAQADNVGELRLRWIPPGSPVEASGSLDDLPFVWAPSPRATYCMCHDSLRLYEMPESSAVVFCTLSPGAIARVLGRIERGWLLLGGGDANRGSFVQAWTPLAGVSINGLLDTVPVLYDWNN